MSSLSSSVDQIGLGVASAFTSDRGQIDAPVRRRPARGGGDPFDVQQAAAKIGDSVPIVFARRVGSSGGVLISPLATEARFTNNLDNDVTASYHLVLSEGVIDGIQVRDVFQQSCRVGSFTQAYNRRAGNWAPANLIVQRAGKSLPDASYYVGSGTGTYQGLSTGSFTVTIPDGFDQWNRQVHVFVRGGVHVPRLLDSVTGPSNNIADLVLYLTRRTSRVPDDLLDIPAFTEAAQFTNANGLLCNMEIREASNLEDFLADVLPYFLLRVSRRNGKRGLRPLLPTNNDGTIKTTAVDWTFQFTDDHVQPGSLQINYISRVQRLPFAAAVVWRQQANQLPLARTSEIRYRGSALEGPFEQHDLSAFCTSENHAFKVGAYIISRRRHVSHRVSVDLKPGPYLGTISAGDIVRLTLSREDSIGSLGTHDFLYEVEQIANSAFGGMTLELTHFPVDDQGRSLVALDVMEAQGSGVTLPTGRAPIDCDANDAGDTTVPTDPGPWVDWDPVVIDPPLYADPNEWPNGSSGDDWGPGPVEPFDPEIPEQSEYIATVTLGTPIVRYPDVFYLVLQENFALVTMEVTVDQAPRFTDLRLTLSNAGTEVPVVIRRGETRAVVSMNGSGTSLLGCTTRTVSIARYEGGGYSLDGLDISAETTYQVCGYGCTVSLVGAERWARNEGEWEPARNINPWLWDGTSEEWTYDGDEITDWTWDVGLQDWQYTGEGSAVNRPDLPPPAPDSLPPEEEGYATFVFRVAADQPPVPNLANDLQIELYDAVLTATEQTQRSIGVFTIPAVNPVVDGWRYNYATQAWDINVLPGNGWMWTGSAWAYMRRIEPGYTYDPESNTWTWTGPEGAPIPPAPPPAPVNEELEVATPPDEVPYADWQNTRASVVEATIHVLEDELSAPLEEPFDFSNHNCTPETWYECD